MTIKAIETRYNGYRFRSRLEARWAVFFDALHIPWQYEKEGYDLGELGYYLPDFWLPYLPQINFTDYPNAGEWLEVKGELPSDIELKKLLELSRGTKHSGNLVVGLPGENRLYRTHHSGHCGWSSDHPLDGLVGDRSAGDWAAFLIASKFAPHIRDLNLAIMSAREARFEHGETPCGRQDEPAITTRTRTAMGAPFIYTPARSK